MINEPVPSSELTKDDIQIVDEEVVILKGHRYYRPYITAAAINDDTVKGDGTLGGVMLAQETARTYSRMSGLPKVEEQLFVVKDDAEEIWNNLKSWLLGTSVNVLQTKIPNANFLSLFDR